MKKQLSKLNKVELRDVWSHEAIDFTNWLSQEENLDALSIITPKNWTTC